MSIAGIRREYLLRGLTKESVDPDPLVQFGIWLEEAIAAKVNDPTAMILATAGNGCQPSARVVLLKDVAHGGLSFYTNFESDKGKQLKENPRAALVFYWPELERQVRLEGITEKLPSGESDKYFNSRPDGSKTGARASPQSSVIASREELEDRVKQINGRFKNKSIPRPSFWGGYRLIPATVEFWQGRPNRLHDRIRYNIEGDQWKISRLAP